MTLNAFALAFLMASIAALLLLPRKWAPVPLVVGACYMTLGQGLMVGSLDFPVIRLLVAAGVVRVVLRGERPGRLCGMDALMLIWSGWAITTGFFHEADAYLASPVIFRLGVVYNVLGVYFLIRVWCQSLEDVVTLASALAYIMVPVALAMTFEKMWVHNPYSILGGVPEVPQIREGNVRAQGPFAHPILAGTVGAVLLPMMVALRAAKSNPSSLGILACVAIVGASASSGPIMSALAGMVGLLAWKIRERMRLVRWSLVALYLGLDLVMAAPAYFLLARIDISGGSTGWHRAELIQSGLRHWKEWWIIGTDYTRHWMPTGVSWNPNYTDITNHYLGLGVMGGMPLMFLFILILAAGFSNVGRSVREAEAERNGGGFFVWSLGACLFAHAATCISVSYFDQSIIFLYINLAAIGSVSTGFKTASSTK